jgi:Fuc2NAc and GlcNAc transferase
MPLDVGITIAATFAVSLLATALIRRFALSRGVLDMPNERSSHERPTPRGGGLSCVVATTLGLVALKLLGEFSTDALLGVTVGGAAIALIGWLDDRQGVSARVRLLVHFSAALWVLAWLGGLPPLQFGDSVVALRWLGYPIGAVGIVWMVNLFNFMDGIDGIAASEAVYVAVAAALIAAFAGEGGGSQAPTLVFAAGAGGFLAWNWPPAKIFMGDVGSGYMGYMIAALAIISARHSPVALLVWVILGGVFFIDATVTLVRRVRAGHSASAPHRSHAYQRLSRRWGSHLRVTVSTLLVNLLWLLPCAWFAAAHPPWAGWSVVAALAPLIVVAAWAGAGLPDDSNR